MHQELKRKLKNVVYTILTIQFGFLFACSQENVSTQTNQVNQATAKKPLPVEAFNLTPPYPVKYNAKSFKDPFEVQEMKPIKKSISATGNALQVYPVNMLKFIGTLSVNGSSFAYVSTPDNKLYQVTRGDTIGDRHGKVINVRQDRLEILEIYAEPGKPVGQHKAILKLRNEN